MKRQHGIGRRAFFKNSAVTAGTVAVGASMLTGQNPELEAAPNTKEETGRKSVMAACPYCGVGCGTLIQVENGKIVSMQPDKDHPTNKGLQCIKGLTAAEPIYQDRLDKVLVRKDVWAEWKKPGHGDLAFVSKTKGNFDEDKWVTVSYEESEEMIAQKVVYFIKKHGGNSIGLYGSGQLTLEGQYLENIFMKGVMSSNTIEANARMCMTSAVTAYFATLGSDTPPLCYDDIELADMVLHFGHNARESHPIVFWRVADHKKKNNIPTVVVDPRETGTLKAFQQINPDNTIHVPILNGDISLLNSIAHVLLKDHPDVIDWNFLKNNTTGFDAYVKGVQERYSPEQVMQFMGPRANKEITPDLIRKIAGMYADATRKGKQRGKGGVLTFWGIGYNQHIHGQHNVISIINLHLLTGNIGRPGAGPFSMTGQPNAMGERFTGGLTGRLPFNKGLNDEAHRKQIAMFWRVPEENLRKAASSKNPGYAVGMMERALKDEVKAMFLIYATHVDLPDQDNLVRPAITKTFTIVQEIYRHAPNNLYADVILPAATWGEVQGVYINSERRIHVVDKAAEPPKNCIPDMDMVIDKGRKIANLLGLDGDVIFPWKRKADGFYDAEEIFREICQASINTDGDLTGILEVEKKDGLSPYDQIRKLRGIQWPAPTYEHAIAGGTKRRYMGQEGHWPGKPYGMFRKSDGKAHFKLCEQDYSQREEITKKLMEFGAKKDHYSIDYIDLIKKARDMGLTPDLPDDEYPLWLGLGVVYEHFHTAKTIRSATTRKLVPELYVEMHENDAKKYGINDGDKVKISSRRGSYEARAQVGGFKSKVLPRRNNVFEGYMFSPWNLSVADSAEPEKNKWLVNRVSSRVWDPISGQVDFKKLAVRIEKI
jgi:ferredoxin-nitrate reductase